MKHSTKDLMVFDSTHIKLCFGFSRFDVAARGSCGSQMFVSVTPPLHPHTPPRQPFILIKTSLAPDKTDFNKRCRSSNNPRYCVLVSLLPVSTGLINWRQNMKKPANNVLFVIILPSQSVLIKASYHILIWILLNFAPLCCSVG